MSECQACTEFRSQRSQLIEDVSLALGEVTKLRRLNEFYKEKIKLLESGGRPSTASTPSFLRRKMSQIYSEETNEPESSVDKSITSREVESTLLTLQESLRILRNENQMLKQQRDDFALQVKELSQKLEGEIAATEDRAEAKLASMRPSSARAGFEEEFKELKRLRVLMRFSELKKDSDKLQETFVYVSKLETENAGLKVQVERMLNKRDATIAKPLPEPSPDSFTCSKIQNLPTPRRPHTSGASRCLDQLTFQSPLIAVPKSINEIDASIRDEEGGGTDCDSFDDEEFEEHVYADGAAMAKQPAIPRSQPPTKVQPVSSAAVGKSFGLASPFGNSYRLGAVQSAHNRQSITHTMSPRPSSSTRKEASQAARPPTTTTTTTSTTTAAKARCGPSTAADLSPSQQPPLPTHQALKKELTTAQALLEMLNSRPLVGANRGSVKGNARPQTAGGAYR